jgi:restriction system protein
VQVKRVKNKISAEQIRSFAGALLLNGMPHGIFVTTSGYTKYAETAAASALRRGYRIELVNSNDFYAALHIAQRTMYENAHDSSAPFACADLLNIGYKKAFI